MAKPIDVSILTEPENIYSDWEQIKSALSESVSCQFNDVLTTRSQLKESLKKTFQESDVILVDIPFRIQVEKHISYQTVRSHFMNYCDYLEKKDDKWWAQSTFSEIFHPLMLDVVRTQKFKGPAIFLGISPLCIPILDTLARVGVAEVAFLKVDDEVSSMEKEFHDSLGALFGIQFVQVDSTAFIQSEKEYAFCFVAKETYGNQVLDDMSYFHFLSQRSTVFDLCRKSNFLFSEVKALGVRVIEEKELSERQTTAYLDKIQRFDATN